MSIALKNIYAGAPATERGRPTHLSVDDKTKSRLIYGVGNNVVLRDLKNPLTTELYTDHAHSVTAARFSPSGYYVCSGDEQGNVRIWATDNKDKTTKLEFRPIAKAVRDVAWTNDNQRVCVVGEGKGTFAHVFLWDSGSPVGEIAGHSANILTCDVKQTRPFRIATGSEDNQVNFYQGPPFKFSHSNKDHQRYVNCVRFNPEGTFFAAASSDKTVSLFDGKTGEKVGTLDNSENGHTGSVYSVAWSPDGKKLLTGAADKTVKMWDLDTKKCIKTFTFPNSVDFMQVGVLWPQPDILLSLGLNGDLNVLDPDNVTTPKKIIQGHNKKIYQLVFDEKSNKFYSAGADGVLIRWDNGVGSSGKPQGKGHSNAISCLALHGNTLVTAAVDQSVRFVDVDSFSYIENEIKLDGLPLDIAASKNSDLLLILTNKSLAVFQGQELKASLPISGYEPTTVALAPSENEVAIGGSDKKVHIYNFDGKSLTPTATLDSHRGKITRVRYSPDGKQLAVGDANREIIVWDVASRKEVHTGLVFHTSQITDLAWSKSGAYLVSSAVDKNVIVWDLAAGKRVIAEGAHLQGVNAVVFADDSTVISAGNDYCIKSWNFKL
jgi:WD40 repeat protein